MQADQPGIDLSKVSVREAADAIARQMAAFRRASDPPTAAADNPPAAQSRTTAGPLRLEPPLESAETAAPQRAPLTVQAEDRIAPPPPMRPRGRGAAPMTLLALTALAAGGAWLVQDWLRSAPPEMDTPQVAAQATRDAATNADESGEIAAAAPPAIAPRSTPSAGPMPRAEPARVAADERFAVPEPAAPKPAKAAAAVQPELKPGTVPPAAEEPPREEATAEAPAALQPMAPAEAALEAVPVHAPPTPASTVRNLATKAPTPRPAEAKPFIPTARPFVPETAAGGAPGAGPEAEPFQPQAKPFEPAARPFNPVPKPFVPSGTYTTAP